MHQFPKISQIVLGFKKQPYALNILVLLRVLFLKQIAFFFEEKTQRSSSK